MMRFFFFFYIGFEIICSDNRKVLFTTCHLKGWESQSHMISVVLPLCFMPPLLVFGSKLLINI